MDKNQEFYVVAKNYNLTKVFYACYNYAIRKDAFYINESIFYFKGFISNRRHQIILFGNRGKTVVIFSILQLTIICLILVY